LGSIERGLMHVIDPGCGWMAAMHLPACSFIDRPPLHLHALGRRHHHTHTQHPTNPLFAHPHRPQGHSGWVTSLATHPDNPNLLLSSSRDKTVLVWNLTGGEDYGYVSAVHCLPCVVQGRALLRLRLD
jgi:hypothetical protein